MSAGNAAAKRLRKDREKAVRALRLYERGHDLLSIAKMCGIDSGSVTRRIEMGKRIREAGIL